MPALPGVLRLAPPAAATVALLALPALAAAAPRGTLIHQRAPAPIAAGGDYARTIYLNRCDGGCTLTPGFPDDSVANVTQLVSSTSSISPFGHDDRTWERTVECVRYVYAPYGIEITTEDPSPAPHYEAIVAGEPQEAGFDPELVGGVGVGGCGELADNSISLTFANIWPADPTTLCYVVAQETAHNFGLDHELEPSDPLTYLPYDGVHLFVDRDVDCGEDVPRSCCAGPAQQNSHQYLLSLFGPGETAAAPVELVRPAEGATVFPGFAIEVGAGTFVESVAVSLNGQPLTTSTLKPFVFDAPDDLAAGPITVEVTGTDLRGLTSTARATVTVVEPPEDEDDGGCAAGGGSGAAAALALAAALGAVRRPARRRAR